ncbi:hypothetical protein [Corynebacterium jeikeium]|uniref:hypothetical protein n=1 Tax=Corynebacterium jeikeium TaxID=38289 RepID=UPI00088E0284|nr:hypothetical protein [Corynebacterium jeikeium]SCX11342.1 hypothetical protein CJBVI_0818 [Corynebacterium jeikeium]
MLKHHKIIQSGILGAALGIAAIITTPTAAFAEEAPQSTSINNEIGGTVLTPDAAESAQDAAKNSDTGNGSWALKPNEDGSVEAAVSGMKLQQNGDDVNIIDSNGKVVETLPKEVKLKSGEVVNTHYTITGENTAKLAFTSDSPHLQKPRWRCYTDPINAGISGGCITGAMFGGIGCGPGAVTGAIGGLASAAFSCAD